MTEIPSNIKEKRRFVASKMDPESDGTAQPPASRPTGGIPATCVREHFLSPRPPLARSRPFGADGGDSTTNLSRIEPMNRIPLTQPLPGGERRAHSNVAVGLRYFLSPASGERIKMRGLPVSTGLWVASTPFSLGIGAMNLWK